MLSARSRIDSWTLARAGNFGIVRCHDFVLGNRAGCLGHGSRAGPGGAGQLAAGSRVLRVRHHAARIHGIKRDVVPGSRWLIRLRNERVQFRREVHARGEVDHRLPAGNRPLPIHQRPQRGEREARALRRDAGIQAQHVEHDRSQLRLQGVGTVGDRLARGLAGRGEQVARLVGAVLAAQIALQLGLYGIGLGGKPGAAEPSGGAFDRLGERRLIVRELLQNHRAGC